MVEEEKVDGVRQLQRRRLRRQRLQLETETVEAWISQPLSWKCAFHPHPWVVWASSGHARVELLHSDVVSKGEKVFKNNKTNLSTETNA